VFGVQRLLALAAAALLPGTSVPAEPVAPAAVEAVEAVVVLHGLGRSYRAMGPLTERLRDAGFDAHNLAYPSREARPEVLVAEVARQIDACCAEAARLHFVGHSLGGILARAYIAERRPANLGRVVMLSPPNQGSEIVDTLGDLWLFGAVMGPSAEQLGTRTDSFPRRLPPPDYELGIIAATESINPVGSIMIPGDDDGMVAVCNMRLEGMADFITVDHTHALIMRSGDVAEQTIRFLREGRFADDEAFRSFDPATCQDDAADD
jgi:pimeloyl-ACP methyl ester carboxylesterase